MERTGLTVLKLQVVVLGLCLAATGCMAGIQTGGPLYQDEFLTVRLEPNPAGAGQAIEGTGAQTITAQQLSGILRGLSGRRTSGLLQRVISPQPEPVFQEEELKLVARELSKGLRVASSQERVAFQLQRAREKGCEETSGTIYLRGNLLYVRLVQFRSSASVKSDDADYIEKPNFELLYEPAEAVVQKEQGLVSRLVGADFPEVIVDIQRASRNEASVGVGPVSVPRAEPLEPARSPQTSIGVSPPTTEMGTTPRPSPTAPAVTVEILQRQVKELTASNQELRMKLKEMRERQGQPQDMNEELARLRQELAETKQLLADMVLELNRLKNQKAQPPSR